MYITLLRRDEGTDLRIAVSRGDDPTEGFIGFKIHIHN